MKINENFTLRQIAGKWVALPLGEATVNFNGMLTLNESGKLLWDRLATECTREELIDLLLSEYEVEQEQAAEDVDAFVAKLTDAGCILI